MQLRAEEDLLQPGTSGAVFHGRHIEHKIGLKVVDKLSNRWPREHHTVDLRITGILSQRPVITLR